MTDRLAGIWRGVRRPDGPALLLDGANAPVSFGDLARQAGPWAARLRAVALLAVEMEPAADVIAAYLAARELGLLVMPVAPGSFAPARGLLPGWAPDAYVRRAAHGHLVLELNAAAPPRPAIDGGALILDSDGTPGRKVVVRADLVAQARESLAAAWPTDTLGPLLLTGPLTGYWHVLALESALRRGLELALSTRSVADSGLWDFARRSGASVAGLTAPQLALAARDDYRGLDQADLRSVVILGGTDSATRRDAADILPEARRWSLRAVEGMAETGPLVIRDLGGPDDSGRADGSPPTTLLAPVRLLDEDGRDITALHQPGEVVLSGAGVTTGLARDRGDLAGLGVPGVRHTGLLAEWVAPGVPGPMGRVEHLAHVGGRRLRLDEVELRLEDAGHPAVAVGSGGRLVLFDLTGGEVAGTREAAAALLGLDAGLIDVEPPGDLPVDASGAVDAAALQARADAVTASRGIPAAAVQALAQATGIDHPVGSDSLHALGSDAAGQALWARRISAVAGDLPPDWTRLPLSSLAPRGPRPGPARLDEPSSGRKPATDEPGGGAGHSPGGTSIPAEVPLAVLAALVAIVGWQAGLGPSGAEAALLLICGSWLGHGAAAPLRQGRPGRAIWAALGAWPAAWLAALLVAAVMGAALPSVGEILAGNLSGAASPGGPSPFWLPALLVQIALGLALWAAWLRRPSGGLRDLPTAVSRIAWLAAIAVALMAVLDRPALLIGQPVGLGTGLGVGVALVATGAALALRPGRRSPGADLSLALGAGAAAALLAWDNGASAPATAACAAWVALVTHTLASGARLRWPARLARATWIAAPAGLAAWLWQVPLGAALGPSGGGSLDLGRALAVAVAAFALAIAGQQAWAALRARRWRAVTEPGPPDRPAVAPPRRGR